MAKSQRQFWLGVLARAPLALLEEKWADIEPKPDYRFLRQPEIGLAMARGRIGGTGKAFNLGEVSMTRCVVALTNGRTGFAYVKGRSKRHAELAASFDALLQDEIMRPVVMQSVIDPLYKQWLAERSARAREVATTKVDFFTMVRGG